MEINELRKSIGWEIKRKRSEAKLNQKELSTKSDVHLSTVRRAEKGERVRDAELIAIINALGFNLDIQDFSFIPIEDTPTES